MLGNYEDIIFAVNEKSRDVGVLDVGNWVQLLNTKVMLNVREDTLSLMVDLINESAIPLKIDNPPPCFSASSFESFSRLEKGESSTTHPISWLVSAYISAVTAPMLLPQIPMLLTVPRFRRYLKTESTSPRS